MRYQFHEHKRISRLSLSIVDFPVFTRYRLTRETIFIRAIHCVKQPRQYVSSKLKFQFTQKVFRIREQCGLTTERLEKLKQPATLFLTRYSNFLSVLRLAEIFLSMNRRDLEKIFLKIRKRYLQKCILVIFNFVILYNSFEININKKIVKFGIFISDKTKGDRLFEIGILIF